ncbi:unnamed protein product [Closterium sp. Naga37s-1]|nr:unnamed protein product [Closterium sp. Naga37s-1]
MSSRSPLGHSPLHPHAVSNSSHVHGEEETDAEEEADRRGFGSYTENNLAEQKEADVSRQTGDLQRKGDGNQQIESNSGGERRVGDGGSIGEEARRDDRNGKTQECYGGAFWRKKSGDAWNGFDSTFQSLKKGWPWGESRVTSRHGGDGGDGGEDSDAKESGCEDEVYGAGRGSEEVEPGTRLLLQMDSIREDGDDEDVILANELEEIDKEVVQEVFNRVSLLRDQVQHYRALGGFVLLMALFVAMVYLQADSSRTYQVTSAHSVLIPTVSFLNLITASQSSSSPSAPSLPPHLVTCTLVPALQRPLSLPPHRPLSLPKCTSAGTQESTLTTSCTYPPRLPPIQNFAPDSSNRFARAADFYAWLNSSIIEKFWQDPPCGDGLCDQPLEFPAFGRFGCEADCGTFPNLTSVSIHFTTSLSSAAALALSAWNLCMHSPISLCWHALPQPFPAQHAQFSLALDIPDGQWALLITAPMGGVQGVLQAQKPGLGHLSGDVTMGSSNSVTLASWGGCLGGEGLSASESNATLLQDGGDVCRQACESVAMCLNAACGREVAAREVAGAFVDCVKICRAAPSTILPYATMSCLQITVVKPSLFPNSLCTARDRRQTQETVAPASPGPGMAATPAVNSAQAAVVYAHPPLPSPLPFPPLPSLRAELPHLSEAPRAWELLGSTEKQRLRALQVAVSRAIYTMVKDSCLAGPYMLGLSVRYRLRLTAFLCTLLGGPVLDQPLCRFADSTGHQLLRAQELNDKAVSSQQLRRFIDILIAALQSVTTMPPQAAADLSSFFHRFEDAIVSTDIAGCSQGGTWLQWKAGVKHNTTIHVGDKVTWVWDDDLPHSLRMAGMGEVADPLFVGFGGNRLAVSRQMVCTPMNVGAGDMSDDPVPCVLRMDDDPAGTFAYSKVFGQPISINYHDGTLPAAAADALSSSSSPASIATSILTVLPASNGVDAAAGSLNTTTAVTNTTNTTAANSTATGRTNTNTTTAYECAPGCLLRQLANGVCDAACNTPSCAFDGGDCACVDPLFGPGICACPPGHTRGDDGSCCLSMAVGANLNFPFSLQRYGPNYTESNFAFAAERGFPVQRFVSSRNRLLIGMVLQQDRLGTQQCNGSGLLHLEGWCSNGTSREPFGVNPHFLPTSAIYDSAASANMTQLDNNTFGDKLRFNPQGLPYGFVYPLESLTTHPLVFDINLDNEAATKRLQYLVDGSYIDNGTRSVDVTFITFNGETLTFVLTTVICMVKTGGSMAVTIKSQPAAMAMYDASADNITRLVLEMVYLVGLLWNVCGELQEMADRAAKDGSWLSYFGLVWNWVDMLSLTLQAIAIALWVVLWRYVYEFDMQPRYDIYYTLLEMPRYWAVPNPPTGFISANQAIADLRNIINLRAIYFALQGIK